MMLLPLKSKELRHAPPSLLLVCLWCLASYAADWPQYRADATRSAYTQEQLPEQLALEWVRNPRNRPDRAWIGRFLSPSRMKFDWCYTPVVSGGKLFFGSSADHQIHALDAATGREEWQFFTGGPVRLAPACAGGYVVAASDDGHLYCLQAASGKLQWKLRAGPTDERMIGNGRLVSRWAARGGPAIRDGVVYFAAGPWPVEGVYLYAVELDTGRVLWCNDSSGAHEIEHPHMGSIGRGGAPSQGYLAVNEDRIFVSTGRSTPAVYDRKTGRLEHFHLSRYGGKTPWGIGGGDTVAIGDVYYNGGFVFDASTGLRYSAVIKDDRWKPFVFHEHKYHGQFLGGPTRNIAVTPNNILFFHGNTLHGGKMAVKTHVDRREAQVLKYAGELKHVSKVKGTGSATKYHMEEISNAPSVEMQWSTEPGLEISVMAVAGPIAYLGSSGRIVGIDIESREKVWSHSVDSTVQALAVADGRLYAALESGAICCFARDGKGTVVKPRRTESGYPTDSSMAMAAEDILAAAGIRRGYCLDIDCGDGELAYHLARSSELHVIGLSRDGQTAEEARRKLDAAGIYGTRVTILEDLDTDSLPPYFANLVVSQAAVERRGRLPVDSSVHYVSPARGKLAEFRNGRVNVRSRPGLTGAGRWTHCLGDSGNSLCSEDELVTGPLGILWFEDEDLVTIDRHGKNPAPLYAGGVVVRAGFDEVKAFDAYNGSQLWKRKIPGLLQRYRGGTGVGAVAMGGIYCIENETLYLRNEDHCLVLDLMTGEQRGKYASPPRPDGRRGTWGYLAVDRGVLTGTLANETHTVRGQHGSGSERVQLPMEEHYVESSLLFGMDAQTGKLQWSRQADNSIRNNAIAMGNGRIYFIDRPVAKMDRLMRPQVAELRRTGKPVPPHPTGVLVCLDAVTGDELWRDENDVFGTTLALSKKHNLLMMCYNNVGRTIPSDGYSRRARCYQAQTGKRVWEAERIGNRPILNDRVIYSFPNAYDLFTGKEMPLSPDAAPDDPSAARRIQGKGIGCGTPLGSRNMLFVRSGVIGYYDIEHDSGRLETYGGIRSGCWLNTIPAGGIVVIPDDTRACRCSFPNQANVALYPRGTRPPEVRPLEDQDNWEQTQRLSRNEMDFTGRLKLKILPPDNRKYQLHYTVDGTVPDTDSPRYSEPFTIEKSTVVNAAAFQDKERKSLLMGVRCVRVESLK